MADAKSNYLEAKTLDHALGTATFTKPTAVHVALHTANPTDSGSASELTGGSYARIQSAFTAAATDGGGVTSASNTGALNWTNLPSATITHVAIYDAATNGNLLYYGALTASKTVTAGDNFTINANALVVQEN